MNWLTFSQSQHLDNQANTVELLSTPEVAGLLPSTWPSSPTRAFVRFDIRLIEVVNKTMPPEGFSTTINGRQQCRLTICIELDELTNSEAAAATPPTVIQNL